MTTLQFVDMAANLTKDRECRNCKEDGDEPNPACTKHKPFDMPSDDAVESLHSLISTAREIRVR